VSVLGEKPLQTKPPSTSLPIARGVESAVRLIIIFYVEKRKRAIQNIGVPNSRVSLRPCLRVYPIRVLIVYL
jgi:hypothetical protein